MTRWTINPRRVMHLLLHDVRLQFRYGIHVAYAVVIAFYVVVLRLGAEHVPGWLKLVVVFTDPSILGFFFLGSLMLLERAENTRVALAVTPTSSAEYLLAKLISLTSLSLLAVCVLMPFLHEEGSPVNWPIFLAAVALSSAHFLGLGVVAVSFFETVSSYLMGAGLGITPIILPGGLALVGSVSTVSLLIPSVSQVALLRVGLGTLTPDSLSLAQMFSVCILSAVGGFWLGVRALSKELGK